MRQTRETVIDWMHSQGINGIAVQSYYCRLGQKRREKQESRDESGEGRGEWCGPRLWVEKAYLKAGFCNNKPASLLLETRPNIILCDLKTCISSLITTQEIYLLSRKQETIAARGRRVTKEKETHLLSRSPILTFYFLASWMVSWSPELEGTQAALGWWFTLTVGLATPVWVAACVISCLYLLPYNEVRWRSRYVLDC